ncbi:MULTISPECIES: hypothetical protein [Klebsiella pneumoniae complex]|uniref:hypothetical protein n=1 Tax=Klebsiella pneumoniae complex TaxID=3390273 RepID=UPI0007CA50D2|nr:MULTISPECIES: hypothetical protein [Klebsiella]HDH1370919.1 hypothetical protein [Klebsiella quasipneumoniae subsp. similipneumoniae]MCD5878044.1 hypothetical protein [Klebsiella pneumoniae]MCD5900751.1 hypothetical protein [Klebsiella pneumoniae]MCP5933718.1 hypothetical protein [Klebsiella pneumoniae]MCP6008807.1 hypothetical protein [Klebsiella pneumoniae]
MTDSMKYLWLLFCEEPSYIFLFVLIVGSAVIVSAFFQRVITSWWGKTLSVILCMVSMITTATGVLDPESTYKQIKNRKENIIYTLKNCRVYAFEAQQAGFLAKAKDAWSCPDGVTRYMDVRYRDKAEINKLSTEGK